MGRIISLMISIAILTAFIAIGNALAFIFFGDLSAFFVWIFSSLLPFRNLLNLQSFSLFILDLMTFEFCYFVIILTIKIMPFFTGHSVLESKGSYEGRMEHMRDFHNKHH